MTRSRLILATALVTLTFARVAVADEPQAPGVETYSAEEKGADLARLWCGACHVTGASQPEQGMDAAPPFATLAPMVRANADHYRVFLTSPHGPMREINLSRDEIEAVLAYIASLDNTDR